MRKSTFNFLLVYSSLFLNSFLSSGQIKADYQVKCAVPITLTQEVNSFFSDTLDLSRSIPAGVIVGVRIIGKNNWFSNFSGIFSSFVFKNDSLDVAINQRFATFGCGKQFELAEKWRTGVSISLGVTRSVQLVTKSKPSSNDVWTSYESNQFDEWSQLTQISPLKFASQVEVYADYQVSSVFDISMGVRNSIISMKNIDNVKGIQLYGNYFLPFVGVRIHWSERKMEN